MARKPTSAERRQRLKSRALPLVGIAFVAFVMGVVQGCPGNPNKDAAGRYVDAWEKGDLEAMYAELSTKSQEAIPLDRSDGAADATVSGEPEAVLLWLWGRRPDDAIRLDGDRAVLTAYRDRLRIATQ